MSTGDYRKIRSFNDEILAQRYLSYVKYFFELYENEEGVDDLYIKKDGEPAYQMFYMDEENNPQLVENVGLYFDLEEILDDINENMADNPNVIYDYNEVDIETEAETLTIIGL
jgi:hypothetical protein